MPQSKRRARDRQVLQPALHEAHDLVAPLARQDEIRMRLVVGEQLVLIGREPEEVALLLVPLDRRALGPQRTPSAPTSVSLSA